MSRDKERPLSPSLSPLRAIPIKRFYDFLFLLPVEFKLSSCPALLCPGPALSLLLEVLRNGRSRFLVGKKGCFVLFRFFLAAKQLF